MASGVNPICATSRGYSVSFISPYQAALCKNESTCATNRKLGVHISLCTRHFPLLFSEARTCLSCQLSQDGSLVPRTTSLRLQGNFFRVYVLLLSLWRVFMLGLLPAHPCNHLEKCVKVTSTFFVARQIKNVFFHLPDFKVGILKIIMRKGNRGICDLLYKYKERWIIN